MQSIKTKYLGPTNYRGARIKASAEKHSVIISYPYELNAEQAHIEAAKQLMNKLGWKGTMCTGWSKDGYVHVFNTGDMWTVQ